MERQYRVKISRSGHIYILFTILLSVAALNTGNNLLYILSSLMLSLMAVSGVTSIWNLLFIDLSLVSPDEIFAEIPAPIQLSIIKKRGQSFFLSVRHAFGSTQVPSIKGKTEHPIWLTFPERGKVNLEYLTIHSGFPFGFFRRFISYPRDLTLIIYPRPIPGRIPPVYTYHTESKVNGSHPGEWSDEVKDLRKFREADPLKWVDWKATARRGEKMVREFYSLKGDTLLIDLSDKTGNWEKRISEACSLVLHGHKENLSTGIILPDQRIDPDKGEEHKKILLEALSLA
jgi:uncharacterized protein (DUF58 family)